MEASFHHSYGEIVISPNGVMSADSFTPGDAQEFTSLAAISYPAAGAAWHKLSLINGWTSSQSQYDSGDPAYMVKNGVVYLSGSLNQPVSGNPEFAVLPKAAWPAHEMSLIVYSFDGVPAELFIETNGDVIAESGAARSYTSLAGVSYPVASVVSHKLTLIYGWIPAQKCAILSADPG